MENLIESVIYRLFARKAKQAAPYRSQPGMDAYSTAYDAEDMSGVYISPIREDVIYDPNQKSPSAAEIPAEAEQEFAKAHNYSEQL